MEQRTNDQTRLTHALMEMHARGLLKEAKLTGVPRLMLHMGKRPIPLEYAPFWRVFWPVAVVSGLPFTAMFWAAFAADETVPGIAGLGHGLGSGVLFGICFAGFLRWQHKEMQLTSWENLDSPPKDAPVDAKTVAEIEALVTGLVGRALR